MANAGSADQNKQISQPDAETLKPRDDNVNVEAKPAEHETIRQKIDQTESQRRRLTYRPSHKATFIGLGVVIAILAINAVVIGFVVKGSGSSAKTAVARGVSISPGVLSKLGVNDTQIGNSNETLIVDPAAQFNSKLSVAGDVNIGGQLNLNSTLTTTTANLGKINASNETVNQISINGNTTTANLSVTGNLGVAGTAQFQNSLDIAQILSVAGSAAIANNLSVGGVLTAKNISTNNLTLSGNLVFGSHLISSGSTPSVGPGGPALGSQGSVSINGDDSAGTISVNIGANAISSGTLVNLAFASQYSSTPSVAITAVGSPANFYLSSLNSSGFSIATASVLPVGHFYIDYIVEQ